MNETLVVDIPIEYLISGTVVTILIIIAIAVMKKNTANKRIKQQIIDSMPKEWRTIYEKCSKIKDPENRQLLLDTFIGKNLHREPLNIDQLALLTELFYYTDCTRRGLADFLNIDEIG